jgi:hypothetical protein
MDPREDIDMDAGMDAPKDKLNQEYQDVIADTQKRTGTNVK